MWIKSRLIQKQGKIIAYFLIAKYPYSNLIKRKKLFKRKHKLLAKCAFKPMLVYFETIYIWKPIARKPSYRKTPLFPNWYWNCFTWTIVMKTGTSDRFETSESQVGRTVLYWAKKQRYFVSANQHWWRLFQKTKLKRQPMSLNPWCRNMTKPILPNTWKASF